MSQTVTLDEVWKLFKKSDRKFQKSREEWERRSQEARQEAELRTQKAAQEWQELRRMMQESSAETDRQMKETDRKMKETDRQMQETDRKIKEVSAQIGQLGGRWGEFVEGLVEPACETLFAQRGIPVHSVSRQMKGKLPGNRHMEVDLVVTNTDVVVLVEVKSKLRHDDVREHLTRVAEFKEFFPLYANMRIMGAVAGIVIEDSVDRFAMNQGLFVIVQAGDTVQLANDETFVPRTW